MDFVALVRSRLAELGCAQKDLAQAAQVADSLLAVARAGLFTPLWSARLLEEWARAADLELRDLSGMTYNPLTGEYRIGRDVDVNYLCAFHRP